ncbi:Hsp20/alpha crystallin family protein [Candidatus Parcubacteria bacterium]|nr:Hsp20/alpha crystallin family protein [Candidatus Parcubacteria bacterium]
MPRAKKMKNIPSDSDQLPQDAAQEVPSQPVAATQASIKKDDAIFDSAGELVADVFETETDFVVLSTIAGVNIKDLDIAIEKDMIVIKGDRPDPHAIPGKKYFYQECYFGPFSRKIVLPANIHTEKASAEMDRGMLTIKIPKMTS